MKIEEILSSPFRLFEIAKEHGEASLSFDNEADARHFWQRIRAFNHTKGKRLNIVSYREGNTITVRAGEKLPKASLSIGKQEVK